MAIEIGWAQTFFHFSFRCANAIGGIPCRLSSLSSIFPLYHATAHAWQCINKLNCSKNKQWNSVLSLQIENGNGKNTKSTWQLFERELRRKFITKSAKMETPSLEFAWKESNNANGFCILTSVGESCSKAAICFLHIIARNGGVAKNNKTLGRRRLLFVLLAHHYQMVFVSFFRFFFHLYAHWSHRTGR